MSGHPTGTRSHPVEDDPFIEPRKHSQTGANIYNFRYVRGEQTASNLAGGQIENWLEVFSDRRSMIVTNNMCSQNHHL